MKICGTTTVSDVAMRLTTMLYLRGNTLRRELRPTEHLNKTETAQLTLLGGTKQSDRKKSTE
jgi:hypothetical protein